MIENAKLDRPHLCPQVLFGHWPESLPFGFTEAGFCRSCGPSLSLPKEAQNRHGQDFLPALQARNNMGLQEALKAQTLFDVEPVALKKGGAWIGRDGFAFGAGNLQIASKVFQGDINPKGKAGTNVPN